MRLATLRSAAPDGQLVVVSTDGTRYLAAGIPSLLVALGDWDAVQADLRALAARLGAGEGEALDIGALSAPLPRTWQWLDGSAYPQHGLLMQQAFGLPPVPTDRPLMYQGMSDKFYGPCDPVPFPSEADGIDFEGEFGVIVDRVPMGTSASDALSHIRLVVQINDWSLRTIAPVEMKTGFGWIQAKPACSMAPFAVTPDALGDAWQEGRIDATLTTLRGEDRFGAVPARADMAFGFGELVAHAAYSRELVAGTVIGSGTISSPAYAEVGSSCISERRAIDVIEQREPTPFLAFGETITMSATLSDGSTPFGNIRSTVSPR